MVYRVLADGIDIFGSDTESSLLSPSLELELNSAGSLEFMLPPDHPSYDDISLMQTEIEVYEDEDLIFFGRPAEVGIDWNKQKKVVCEGALAYLNDAAIRPHKFEGALISDVFKYIIAQYNAQVAQNKQFIVGNITITDRYVYTEFDYDICLSVLISTCIDSTGGYLFLRKEDAGIYIDWLDEVPDVSDQPVQFASNMLDLNQDTRAEDICTVVLPVGGQVDGVNITIASVNEGSDILEDSDAIAKYGRILKIQQWNDIIDPQALKDKATEWLAKQQEDDITIETDAAELHYLDGSVGAYRIGQLVNVISGPHGVDKEYPILKMSMNLDSGTKKITLGTPPRKELTELSGITNSTGGSSSSGGGGGGGSSDGVRDVLVNGSSVVSDHVARVSAVTAQQLADGLALKADEDDFEALQTTVAGKASQADLNALSTTVAGKQDQLTPGTGISIDANNVISATGGGGTEVEANPSETATDDLNTIKIGNTVYDIPGGGSSTNYGKFKCDVLFNTPTTTSAWASPIEICSEEKAKEYDMIYLITKFVDGSSNGFISNSYLVNSIGQSSDNDWMMGIRSNSRWNNPEGFVFLSFDNSKLKFYTNTGNSSTLYKVYGLKFDNKLINRSDIYSEEERMIGRWTDGKPLYQKTYRNIRVTNNANNVVDSNFGTDKNICTHDIEFRGISGNYRSDYNTSVDDTLYSNNNGQLVYYFYKSGSWSQLFDTVDITIQYTKTTDTPGSGVIPEDPLFISDPMIFSEEEQVVGSWTDGKPLYQKTYDFGSAITINADSWYNTGISSGDIERIIEVSNGQAQTINTWPLGSAIDNGTIRLLNERNNIITLRWFTIQYTKTTDSILSGPKKGKIVQKSDIYYEEERLVGRWTDGKPLYQKTWSGLNVTPAYNSWTPLGITIPNSAELIDWKALYKPQSDNIVNLSGTGIEIRIYQNALQAEYNQNANVRPINVLTLQYTKTTDLPFSKQLIEDPQFVMMSDIYSEDEQVVGRWADGKPLYQKIVDCGYGPNSSVKEVDLTALNIDNCIQIGGYMCYNSTSFLPIPRVSDRYIADQLAFSYNNSTKMLIITCRDRDMTAMRIMAILKYTKTTDAPGTGPTKGNLIYLPALYSEEEREVGVWTDGKPLYQKTFKSVTSQQVNDWTVFDNVNAFYDILVNVIQKATFSNLDQVMANPDQNTTPRFAVRSDHRLYYYSDTPITTDITIQYTKTTDQPGSGTWTPEGQLAHHYSTSEKIVGTWIDGSTVYERTQNGGISISANDTWYDTIFTGVNKVISFNCSLLRDGEEIGSEFNSGHIDYVVRNNIVKIKGYGFSLTDNFTLDKLTIQYTKTS